MLKKGILKYKVKEGKDSLRNLTLTVCSSDDFDLIHKVGVPKSRRVRIMRLLEEARSQGSRLSYRDLSLIFLTSRATLKRDMREIRRQSDIPEEIP